MVRKVALLCVDTLTYICTSHMYVTTVISMLMRTLGHEDTCTVMEFLNSYLEQITVAGHLIFSDQFSLTAFIANLMYILIRYPTNENIDFDFFYATISVESPEPNLCHHTNDKSF